MLSFIKNLFSSEPVVARTAKYTQFNIGINSRITIDYSTFLAYDEFTIITNPGELVVQSVRTMCEYGVEVFDFYCVSSINRSSYIVRLQQDSTNKLFMTGHVFTLVQTIYPSTAEMWTELLDNLRTKEEWHVKVNEALYVGYLADMVGTYTATQYVLDAQGNKLSFAKKLEGRDYCRAIDPHSTVFETCLVEVVDNSEVLVYAGLHLNQMGLSVV